MTAAAAATQPDFLFKGFNEVQLVEGSKGPFYLFIYRDDYGVQYTLRMNMNFEKLIEAEMSAIQNNEYTELCVVLDPYSNSGDRFRLNLSYYREAKNTYNVATASASTEPMTFELASDMHGKSITTSLPLHTYTVLRERHQKHKDKFPRFCDYTRALLVQAVELSKLT